MSINNGIVYTPENTGGHSIINGVPATEHNGLHLVQGSRIIEATEIWPNFTVWTETDPNSVLSLDDASIFNATLTQDGDPGNNGICRVTADAGSAYWDGAFTMRWRHQIQRYIGNWQNYNHYTTLSASLYDAKDLGDTAGKLIGMSPNEDSPFDTTNFDGLECYGDGSSVDPLDNASPIGSVLNEWLYLEMYRSATLFGYKVFRESEWDSNGWDGTPVVDLSQAINAATDAYRYITLVGHWSNSAYGNQKILYQMISITPNPWA